MKWGYGWGWGCRTLLPRSWPASPPPSSPPLGTTWPWECPPCAKPPRLGTKAHVCPLKCITRSRNVAHGSAALRACVAFPDRLPGHGGALLAQVAKSCVWGLCSKHSTRQVDHTCKKGRGSEEERNESSLAGNKTSYPDIPPRLAKCPGPEGPDRTRSPPGREESLQTLPPWKPLEAPGAGWPRESSGAVAAPPRPRSVPVRPGVSPTLPPRVLPARCARVHRAGPGALLVLF